MLGVIAAQRRDYDSAIGHLTRASRANPSAVEVHINLGRIQAECRDYPAAVASLARALAINPRHPLANNNYGSMLSQLKRMEEALLHLQRATAAAPDYFDAWHNQGNVLSKMRRFKEAFIAYDTAFRLNPAAEETEGARLFAKLQICDWSNFETERSRLVSGIRSGRFAAPPLIGLPELITHTSTAYEDRAVELVTDREKLQTLKQKLAHNRHTMPLFDTEAFTRHIEAAYSLMIERHRAGVPPDHIQALNSADHT